ncbi:MAG: hypothetical protein RBR01_01260 [Desulfobacterales bacterium]|nr:hypothetical protein [Desulfobacterales bacterium]MDD3081020.1 hypothetical protein [Desulfobacterales bacterium]MDD3950487.1 hypothetical protein [Desulfobacterales bacterium]MDD4463489.1 hypothetical protein [Desulfobacterales bacterium]MDY0377045.1 hypothetical protein [Desulfobacterales bacterium]
MAEIAETDVCMGLNRQNSLFQGRKHRKKDFKCQESGCWIFSEIDDCMFSEERIFIRIVSGRPWRYLLDMQASYALENSDFLIFRQQGDQSNQTLTE